MCFLQVMFVQFLFTFDKSPLKQSLGGGFKYFLFSSLFGEDEPNLTFIFFRWVGKNTKQITIFCWGVGRAVLELVVFTNWPPRMVLQIQAQLQDPRFEEITTLLDTIKPVRFVLNGYGIMCVYTRG